MPQRNKLINQRFKSPLHPVPRPGQCSKHPTLSTLGLGLCEKTKPISHEQQSSWASWRCRGHFSDVYHTMIEYHSFFAASGSDTLPGLLALRHFTLGVALPILHAVLVFGAEPGEHRGPDSYTFACATVRNNSPPRVLSLTFCMSVDVREVTGSSQPQLPRLLICPLILRSYSGQILTCLSCTSLPVSLLFRTALKKPFVDGESDHLRS